MELDIQKLTDEMIANAAGALPGRWQLVREFAEPKFRGIAETLVAIEKEKAAGNIDEKRAAIRIATQKKRLESVMLAVQGIEKLAHRETRARACPQLGDRGDPEPRTEGSRLAGGVRASPPASELESEESWQPRRAPAERGSKVTISSTFTRGTKLLGC
jgi:hypothetical protein